MQNANFQFKTCNFHFSILPPNSYLITLSSLQLFDRAFRVAHRRPVGNALRGVPGPAERDGARSLQNPDMGKFPGAEQSRPSRKTPRSDCRLAQEWVQ